VRHERGLVGMGELVEPGNLGVQVTAQQEVEGHLGGSRQLVPQSKEGVNYLRTWKGFPLGQDTGSTKHGILSEAKKRLPLQQTHTH